MIVSVMQENLALALRMVARAIDASPPLPILANILIEAKDSSVFLSATDLEFSISTRIGAKVEQPGAITLPATTLRDLVSTLAPERVDMRLDRDNWTVNLRCGIQVANIRGIEVDEYPPINHIDTEEHCDLQLAGEVLRDAIKQVAFCAATDQNRPILTGVYFCHEGETLTLAAADGYRLAVRKIDVPGQVASEMRDMVIPAKTVAQIAQIIDAEYDIKIAFPRERQTVTFSRTECEASVQLLEGRFPDYASIIPRESTKEAVCYTSDVLIAAKRAAIFARDNAYICEIKMEPGRNPGEAGLLNVKGISSERGDAESMLDCEVEMDAPSYNGTFNVRYLITAANAIPDERLVLAFTENESPGVIKPEGRDDLIYVVMPMD